jgi:hypothetical protein
VARPPEPRPSGGARGSARSRKARSTRSAVDGFAQALARAQDPTTAEVSDELLADASVSLQVDEVPAPPAEQPIEEAPGLEATAAAAEPTVAEPEIVAAEPEIVATEPEIVAPEPEIVAAEPETIAAEPGPTVAEPAASEFEPQAEPEVAAVEPEPVPIVVESDLAAAAELEPEPVAEPDPAAAALQAAFDEPETTPEESAAPATEAQGASEARTTAASELEAAPPTYSANVVEPDWFADGDFAWLDAAELEASSPSVESAIDATPAEAPSAGPAPAEMPSAEPTPAEAAAAEPEPEPPGEAASESISASEIDAAPWAEPEVVDESDRLSMPDLPPMPDLPAAVDLPATPEAPLQASPEFQGEPEVAESVVELPEPVQPFEATQAIEPAEIERADAEAVEPVQPATPDESIQARGLDAGPSEEQVMWLGAESRAAAELETASSGWRAEPQPAPTITAQPPVAVAEPPLLRMTEEELARLARDEGWDEAEVAAIRAMIVPPPAPRVRLPGAAELDEAMAALQAVPVDGGEEASSSREWAKPPGETRSPRYDDWAFEVDSAPQRRIVDPLPPRSQPPDPGWLRRRQGPAATAYRRLRRLFPG